MQMLLHTPEKVRIINEALTPSEFECTPDEWLMIQPAYPALPEGMTGRYWTPEQNYLMNGVSTYPEDFNGASYCQAVNLFTPPCIYANLTLSADRLRIDDPNDSIVFSATLEDAGGNVLPVPGNWIIRLRDADGEEVDAFEVDFVDGTTGDLTYTCPTDVSLGRIHIDENDFIPVEVPGVGTFTVLLKNPIEFTIYRQLQEV